MAPSRMSGLDFFPEPDLHPLCPTTAYIESLLSPHSGLAPAQKVELASHCLTRSCAFADLAVLQFLLSDPHTQTFADLSTCDEDGVGLVSLSIHGFGGESDRDVEREECIRLLVAQGADMGPDNGMHWCSYHSVLWTELSCSWLDSPASCSVVSAPNSGFISYDAWMFRVLSNAPKFDTTRHCNRALSYTRAR
jgi:hypothetical protein